MSIAHSENFNLKYFILSLFNAFLFGFIFHGCATPPKKLMLRDIEKSYLQDTIIFSKDQEQIGFETLMHHLRHVRVIYVGERHSDQSHHDIQLKILKSFYEVYPDICVGMEMFDKSYQHVLDQWSKGQLDESELLKRSHWYANWRYPFALYRDLLLFIRENNIPLIGLNIPFHMPPKIAIGGVENLLEHDRQFLPEIINKSVEDHRKYIEKIYEIHKLRRRDNFETFYEVQCVWEDTMAEMVAIHSRKKPMIVLTGNSHIIYKFGIPNRAFQQNPLPFKTIYLAPAGESAELGYADYIWVTPEIEKSGKMPINHPE